MLVDGIEPPTSRLQVEHSTYWIKLAKHVISWQSNVSHILGAGGEPFSCTNYIIKHLIATHNLARFWDLLYVTWRNVSTSNLIPVFAVSDNSSLFGVTPLDNHRRKRRLQIAPQRRLSRSIHFYFLTSMHNVSRCRNKPTRTRTQTFGFGDRRATIDTINL